MDSHVQMIKRIAAATVVHLDDKITLNDAVALVAAHYATRIASHVCAGFDLARMSNNAIKGQLSSGKHQELAESMDGFYDTSHDCIRGMTITVAATITGHIPMAYVKAATPFITRQIEQALEAESNATKH